MTAKITWDLRLHPPALNTAFWQDVSGRLLQSDRQVASYFVLAVAVMSIPQLSAADGVHQVAALSAAWALALSWIVLLQLPKLYTHNRLLILTVLRLLMAYAASTASSCGRQEELPNPQDQEAIPASSMLMQLLLLTKSVHIPMLAVRLPMPILLQLLLTAVQPLLLLWAGIASDLAAFTNSAGAQSTLRGMIASWGALVESGTYVPATDSELLQGRSSALLLALCTMYATTVAVSLYVCYMSLWADMLRWLRQKAKCALEEEPESDLDGCVTIHGCMLQRQQLRAMLATPAVMLLFNARSRMLIHLAAINIVCLACLLLSQGLAQKLLPHMLSQQALDGCYPLVTHIVE